MAPPEDYEQVYILKNGKVVADSRELGYYLFTRKRFFSVCFHLHHSAVAEIRVGFVLHDGGLAIDSGGYRPRNGSGSTSPAL